jgi:hypothetical protein
VALFVAALLPVWVALAYASPPDASSIPGIYDERDFDDVVGMATDASGLNDGSAPDFVQSPFRGFAALTATRHIANATRRRQTIRGPPTEPRDISGRLPLTCAFESLSAAAAPSFDRDLSRRQRHLAQPTSRCSGSTERVPRERRCADQDMRAGVQNFSNMCALK